MFLRDDCCQKSLRRRISEALHRKGGVATEFEIDERAHRITHYRAIDSCNWINEERLPATKLS
jgi:hypothetical protein